MTSSSLGILGARANAECLEDKLGIMLGYGKTAFGRRRSADAANREAYEGEKKVQAQSSMNRFKEDDLCWGYSK